MRRTHSIAAEGSKVPLLVSLVKTHIARLRTIQTRPSISNSRVLLLPNTCLEPRPLLGLLVLVVGRACGGQAEHTGREDLPGLDEPRAHGAQQGGRGQQRHLVTAVIPPVLHVDRERTVERRNPQQCCQWPHTQNVHPHVPCTITARCMAPTPYRKRAWIR